MEGWMARYDGSSIYAIPCISRTRPVCIPAADGRRLRPAGEGVDHAAGIYEPAGGSSSKIVHRAFAERRIGVLSRRAEEAHLLCRPAEVLPDAGSEIAARQGDQHRQNGRGPRDGGAL